MLELALQIFDGVLVCCLLGQGIAIFLDERARKRQVKTDKIIDEIIDRVDRE